VLEFRSRDQLRDFLEKEFSSGKQAKEIEQQGTAYRRLGMLPDSIDLKKLYLDLLSEQVAGYYDPKTKKLYVVEGQTDDLVGVTIGHELVHALQDQYLNLDSLAKADVSNDRAMAAQAVIEGQAMYEQLIMMLGPGDLASRLPGGWDMVRQQIRENSASQPRFAEAPFLVQEDLIFPYLSGAEFMRNFKKQAKAGELVYAKMPQSTEQLMHPDKLYTATPDTPTEVTLPAPRGAAVSYQNTFGEFETRLFLYQHLQDQTAAYRGAGGWDGDRYEVLRFATGEGIAWLTVWDSAVDAGEFYELSDRTVIARYKPKTYRPLGATGKQYTLGGRTIRIQAVEVQGRPAVLYVDVPAGTDPDVVDVAKVTLTGN
jgi:hypothetical protein